MGAKRDFMIIMASLSSRPSEWFTATVRFISNWSIFVDVAVPDGGGRGLVLGSGTFWGTRLVLGCGGSGGLVQGILHKSQFPYPEKAGATCQSQPKV